MTTHKFYITYVSKEISTAKNLGTKDGVDVYLVVTNELNKRSMQHTF